MQGGLPTLCPLSWQKAFVFGVMDINEDGGNGEPGSPQAH